MPSLVVLTLGRFVLHGFDSAIWFPPPCLCVFVCVCVVGWAGQVWSYGGQKPSEKLELVNDKAGIVPSIILCSLKSLME